MRKIILPLLLCLISTSVFAEILTFYTYETHRFNESATVFTAFEVHQTITFYGVEFVSIETNRHDSRIKSFTGKYTVLDLENVYDEEKGSGVLFYLKKNNDTYFMTIFDKFIVMGEEYGEGYLYVFHFMKR
jgi:hypothetical protein